ncbi:hypothetical protein F383_26964 [Gossypium arboreum]|uniref:Uncharacterized protein n=1 Tax=Gossypium arboreum TaxID=29729 RepID=A0A0B0MWR7_GOSAR|nr:hypothetical protein F383_26964 [Gossypium arboreum]
MFAFYLPYNANDRISFTHILGYEFTIYHDAIYYKSCIPNSLAFNSYLF